jgi:hypothetical protein
MRHISEEKRATKSLRDAPHVINLKCHIMGALLSGSLLRQRLLVCVIFGHHKHEMVCALDVREKLVAGEVKDSLLEIV